MHLPKELYQIEEVLVQRFPHLRRAQQHGLALWVYGTILAGSACQNAVLTVLKLYGGWHTLRQALREWLYDGKDRAAPCQTQVEVSSCVGPLVRWVLEWWGAATLAVAVD